MLEKKKTVAKVQRILEYVEEYFIDSTNGLMFSYLDRGTLRPATPEFFTGRLRFVPPEISMTDLYRHENVGMCNGSLMVAEILRYKATNDAVAMMRIKRAFDGLYQVFTMGKQLDYGFYPKIYGGKFSRETSTDQVLYACFAADCYYALADETDRRRIIELITALVGFWVKRDYRYHYFSLQPDDWQWPLQRFPALLALAYRYSNEKRFLDEYHRLVSYTETPENASLWQRRNGKVAPSEYELKHQAWLTGNGADRITMDTMQYDLLLRLGLGGLSPEVWRNGLKIMWDEVKESFCDDGKYYSMQLFDFTTGVSRRTPCEPAGDFPGAKSAWSTMVARGGMMVAKHVPELAPEILPKVDMVLEKLDWPGFTYYDEPERFPTEMRYKTKLLSSDAVSNYLWCAGLRLYGTEQENLCTDK